MIRAARSWLLLAALALATGPAAAAEDGYKMKFNEVKEIAPGVFFRYSAISATDKSVAFGGSNNIWIVFDDFVAVIDAIYTPKRDFGGASKQIPAFNVTFSVN